MLALLLRERYADAVIIAISMIITLTLLRLRHADAQPAAAAPTDAQRAAF